MRKKHLLAAASSLAVGALLVGLVVGLTLTPAPAFAQVGKGSPGNILTEDANPHNLSMSSTSAVKTTTVNRKCVFCHTPHAASTTAVGVLLPLWNHDTIAANNFTPYGDPNSTIDALDIDSTVGTQSLACFSCHDGVIALDALVNFPNLWPAPANIIINDVAGRVTGEVLIGDRALSTDLSNDHPVGFTNTGDLMDDDLKPVDVTYHFGPGQDQVECASCHTVHLWNAGVVDEQPFLRSTMDDSALCGICHTK